MKTVFQNSRDERFYPRRMTSVDVTLSFGLRSWKAYFTDLSAGGAFVETSDIPLNGGTVKFDFTLAFPEKGIQVRFQVQAKVVRSQTEGLLSPSGFSARFLDLTEKERYCLEAYAKRNAVQSKTVLLR